MANAPGTIDSGYRGQINVSVVNHDQDKAIGLRRGERIAQRVGQAGFEVVERLPESVHGAAGHGPTGAAAELRTGDLPPADNRGDDR